MIKKLFGLKILFQQNEYEISKYNFEEANVGNLVEHFKLLENEAHQLISKKLMGRELLIRGIWRQT